MINSNDFESSILEVTDERVDDVPLLLAQMVKMDLPLLLDKYFLRNGNWLGLSFGWTTCIWLSHILSEADHRLSHVQSWSETLLSMLSKCAGQPVRALDFSDDRLGDILKALSQNGLWLPFEQELGGRLMRVYDLGNAPIRLDTTTSSGYWKIVLDGLFQKGHSKDYRPSLPQLKIMFAALDPLALPLVTTVVGGQKSDDPLYLPAIAQVHLTLGRRGLLYVGDCKMGSLQTRLEIAREGDFYLSPLSSPQLTAKLKAQYLKPVLAKEQSLSSIYRQNASSKIEEIGQGYEIKVEQSGQSNGEEFHWWERRLIVRSEMVALADFIKFEKKIRNISEQILALNNIKIGLGIKIWSTKEDLSKAVGKITGSESEVERFLSISYQSEEQIRDIPARIKRPAHQEKRTIVVVGVVIDEEGLAKYNQELGWRVYVTNQIKEQLSMEQAVLCYREEYKIEHDMARLKGPLSIRPFYLENEDHAVGLVKLLSLGLRVLNLIEYVVRLSLMQDNKELKGLYHGNAKRATSRPSTELLLQAFKGVSLHKVKVDDQIREYIKPLSKLQVEILEHLGLGKDIYNFLVSKTAPVRG